MTPFDSTLAISTLVPMLLRAYDSNSAPLPADFESLGTIQADLAVGSAVTDAARLLKIKIAPGDPFGYVAVNAASKTAVVVIRGTESPEEWIQDFDELAVPEDDAPAGVWVHQGFQGVFRSIRQSLTNLIAKVPAGTEALVITGHSLGAALAVLAASHFAPWVRTLGDARPALLAYTFAGPRTGTPFFANWFNTAIPNCYRIVNKWDIVPQVPLPPLYMHVGQPVSIDGGFTTDLHVAHNLTASYLPGLNKLIARLAA